MSEGFKQDWAPEDIQQGSVQPHVTPDENSLFDYETPFNPANFFNADRVEEFDRSQLSAQPAENDGMSPWQGRLAGNLVRVLSYEQHDLGVLRKDLQWIDQPQGDLNVTNWNSQALATEFPQHYATLDQQHPGILNDSWAINTSDNQLEPLSSVSNIPIAGLHFANRAQAQQAFSRRHIPHDWHPPTNDKSLPRENAHRERYIAQLMTAFIDVSQCQNHGTLKSFQQRWPGLTQNQSSTTSQYIETVCWKLLDIAETLHRVGPRSLHIFDENKFRMAYKSRNMTFSKRIRALCKLMRMSKARCSKLFDFDDLENIVAAPDQVLRLSEGNKQDNRRRQEFLIEGRAQAKNDGAMRQQNDLSPGHVANGSYKQIKKDTTMPCPVATLHVATQPIALTPNSNSPPKSTAAPTLDASCEDKIFWLQDQDH
jgi:hypothetical protein